MTETVGLMVPMLPPENASELNDLALDLATKVSSFAGMLNPVVSRPVGDLVRSMNGYSSNLIEGHDTHPRGIDRAIAEDYSSEQKKRALQKEAVAHIAVQKMIADGEAPALCPLASEYGQWIHKEFCERLPEELLWVETPDTGEKIKVIPGVHRERIVKVGRHIQPLLENLDKFLRRFDAGRKTRITILPEIAPCAWVKICLPGYSYNA